MEQHSGKTKFDCDSGESFTVGFAFQVPAGTSGALASNGTWNVVTSVGFGDGLSGGGTWILTSRTPIQETWTGTLQGP